MSEFDKERYFKQINISEKFTFNEYIDERYIKFKCASLHLPCIKLINSIEGISYEGQKLSGKKLILCGFLDTSFYIDCGCRCSYIKKDIPLSTFIVVPSDVSEEDSYKINYCIDDVTITNIEYDFALVSITLFLEYISESNV